MATLDAVANRFGKSKGVKSTLERKAESDFNKMQKNLKQINTELGLKIPDSVFGTFDTIKEAPLETAARSFDKIGKEMKKNFDLVNETDKKEFARLNKAFMAKAGSDVRTMADLEARANAARRKIKDDIAFAYDEFVNQINKRVTRVENKITREAARGAEVVANFIEGKETSLLGTIDRQIKSVENELEDAEYALIKEKARLMDEAAKKAKKAEQGSIGFFASALKAAESVSGAIAGSVKASKSASNSSGFKVPVDVKNAMAFALKETKNALDTAATYAGVGLVTALGAIGKQVVKVTSMNDNFIVREAKKAAQAGAVATIKAELKASNRQRVNTRNVKYISKKIVNGIPRYIYPKED
jgi:hypothetical protein